jgi:hypothetical protein
MRQSLSLGLMAALTLLALALTVAPAGAETVNCTVINAVPFTIASPGIYCLNSHLNTNISSGNAITVNADNVVIDLNGHVLSNNGPGGGTQARGVFSNNRRDVTVKNGTIRVFHTCVQLDETLPAVDSRTHIVEDLKLENCRARGMWVIGQSSTVRRNVVRDTGGNRDEVPHWGINVIGQGSQVLDNLVHRVHPRHLPLLESWGDLTSRWNNRVSEVDQGTCSIV